VKNPATKSVSDSVTTLTEIVLPNDANPLGFLRGGRLMDWMDIASEVTAQKHAKRLALTVALSDVTFKRPIKVGDIVTIRSRITATFKTSMEIEVEVWAENIPEERKFKTNEACFTFVAIDDDGKPVAIPQITPQTSREREAFEAAIARKKARRSAPGNAT